jgi:superfamily I DNA/RNA helicase
VGTFHGLGYRILQDAMQNDARFAIADEATRLSIIRDSLILHQHLCKKYGIDKKNLLEWIVSAKQMMIHSKDPARRIPSAEDAFFQCYLTYQHLLNINHLFDYEDLICKAVGVLETAQSDNGDSAYPVKYIFIDEYQDINSGQYRLVQLLAGDQARITVIGDPDQAIYGFRGSDVNCFSWLMMDRLDTEKIFLRQNYRSTQTILQISNQVVRMNPDPDGGMVRREICSNKKGDPTIHLAESITASSEAVFIGRTIEKMVGGTGFFSLDSGAVDGAAPHTSLGFSDFAVLYRTRRQGELIYRILQKAGIPCQRVDKKQVLGHPGITSLLSTVKMMSGKGGYFDLQRAFKLLNRPISDRTLERFKAWAYENDFSLDHALRQAKRFPIPRLGKKNQQTFVEKINYLLDIQQKTKKMPVRDLFQFLMQRATFLERKAKDLSFERSFAFLVQKAAAYGHRAGAFLSSVALSSDGDMYDSRVEKVTLTTMHAAKGLEFSVVFISGCEDGLIPFRSVSLPVNVQEERRLFYVALTRAEDHLFLTKADRRRIHGQMKNCIWSPFVNDIDTRYKQISISSPMKSVKPAQEQLSLF